MKEIQEIIKEGYRQDVSLQEIEHFEEGLGLLKMLNNLKSNYGKYDS